MVNVVGNIPEFTSEEGEAGEKEVKKITSDELVEEGKETPTEPPADEKPTEEEQKPLGDDSTGLPDKIETSRLEKDISGLHNEKEALLEEIKSLRGERRTLKQKELDVVQERLDSKVDELQDLHPEDKKLLDKYFHSQGFVTQKELYERVKNEEVNRFLDKYPEYKPENDPSDRNWSRLQREFSLYRLPNDPKLIGELLERSHRATTKPVADRTENTIKKRQAQIAGAGAGGVQRSSSKKPLPAHYVEHLKHGGWSDEEIANYELPE